jgi:NodT family efflux transporter outer membrane factor (OMF) lipoprotein
MRTEVEVRGRWQRGLLVLVGFPRLPHSKRQVGLCRRLVCLVALVGLMGCTSVQEYISNGFKVGPNYAQPGAPVAQHWIDAEDVRIRSQEPDDSQWWTVFNDPLLNNLVQTAYHQNLTLREAGFRVLQARAERGIAVGELFPQTQVMNGDAVRRGLSENVANRVATPERWFSQWDYGFGVSWELDFWGRYRRAVEVADAQLDASIENYDDVLVILVSDVASEYVRVRMYQEKLAYARRMVSLHRESLAIASAKYTGGKVSKVDVNQAASDVSTTEALIQELEIGLRKTTDRLCVLLGRPAEDIMPMLGEAMIPTAPPEVAVGIPAQLICRRPDIRRADRHAAAECAKIGVATADFYPQISVDASFGWSSQDLTDLFSQDSFRGGIGPAFKWPILNYGRIVNNVRAHDARFQQKVANYQQTVLNASAEVEDGLVTFLRAKLRSRDMDNAVSTETEAFLEVLAQYKGGLIDYNRVALIQERLVERQQILVETRAQDAQGLVQVYRALGGGWQIHCSPEAEASVAPPPAPPHQTMPGSELSIPMRLPDGEPARLPAVN